MPSYKYKGIDKNGSKVSGRIDSESNLLLKIHFQEIGVVPYEIVEESVLFKQFSSKKISEDDLSLFFYQTGILLKKGVVFADALEIVQSQFSNDKFRSALFDVKKHVESGADIADAFRYTKIFPEFALEMIKAGAVSGRLDQAFLSASEYMVQSNEFKKQIINSLIYPAAVIIAGFIAMIVIAVFVMPKISSIYISLGKELPVATKFTLFISKIILFLLKISPIFILIYVIFFKKYTQTVIKKTKERLPFFNKIYLYSSFGSWSKLNSMILKSGSTLVESLDITENLAAEGRVREGLKSVKAEISKGKRFSEELKKRELLPENIIQLVRIGEETGSIDEIMEVISDLYQKQVNIMIKRFLTLLEPISIIVLTVFAGLFVFAGLMPILNLSFK